MEVGFKNGPEIMKPCRLEYHSEALQSLYPSRLRFCLTVICDISHLCEYGSLASTRQFVICFIFFVHRLALPKRA
jgi:hypothetical protein